MADDLSRRAREAWRRPPSYRVHGRRVRASLDMLGWARRPPFMLWPAKWPLLAMGLILLWIVLPPLELFSLFLGTGEDGGSERFRPRQFPGAK